MSSLKLSVLTLFISVLSFSSILNAKDISHALASITVDTESNEISNEAVVATQKAIIDVLGVSFAGFTSPGMLEIRNQFKEWGGNPQASSWIDGEKLSVPDAAFINSSLVHALDLDDVHLPSHTHLTSIIIPAAFAVGEYQNSTGREIIDAIVIGLEVAGRLGREYDSRVEHTGFLPTSIIGGFGAAAVASRLLNLTVEQTMDAFGIFYAHASGNRQALYDRTITKRIQPAIACRAGIVAAYFAKQGITGPWNIFLSDTGLFSIYGANKKPFPTSTNILAKKDFFEVEKLSYKKYASCGGGHPVILAAIELAESRSIKIKDIEKIELFILPGLMFGVPWEKSDNPHVLAQFCSPYQVVTAIKNRKQGPFEIDNNTIQEDREVYELAKKVIMKPRKDFKPGNRHQAIRITLKNGTELENFKTVQDILGIDKMTYEDIVDKYLNNIEYSNLLTKTESKELLKEIEKLKTYNNINNIMKYLIINNK
jgi:2-methylcitrate dehydratase PrpD